MNIIIQHFTVILIHIIITATIIIKSVYPVLKADKRKTKTRSLIENIWSFPTGVISRQMQHGDILNDGNISTQVK